MSLCWPALVDSAPRKSKSQDCNLFMVARNLVSAQLMLPKVFAIDRARLVSGFQRTKWRAPRTLLSFFTPSGIWPQGWSETNSHRSKHTCQVGIIAAHLKISPLHLCPRQLQHHGYRAIAVRLSHQKDCEKKRECTECGVRLLFDLNWEDWASG